MAPIEPPHPKRTLEMLDAVLKDLEAFRDADPNNQTLQEAEAAAQKLHKLLSSYSDSYVPKGP